MGLYDWLDAKTRTATLNNTILIVDFHSPGFLEEDPENICDRFQLCVVLKCDNKELFQRLHRRGYSQKKVTENVECEIFQIVEGEAKTIFPNRVAILQNESNE